MTFRAKKELSLDSTFDKDSENNLCLTDIINSSIFDVIYQGIEYEVIAPEDFFSILESKGIKPKGDRERTIIDKVLKLASFDEKWYLVSTLTDIMATFKIREHIPEDTRYLKYSILKSKDIRIINRLKYYMKKHDISLAKEVFHDVMFTQSVVSLKNKGKERVIELCSADDVFKTLK